jgi:hypothetical protein
VAAELLSKRLKLLLHLDTLPSREGPTAKSWMLARLMAAGLAQRLCSLLARFPPWGYVLLPIAERNPRTHSPWSRFRMTLWAMRGAVLGKGPWLLIQSEDNLDRLRNSPRQRRLVSHDLHEQLPLFK